VKRKIRLAPLAALASALAAMLGAPAASAAATLVRVRQGLSPVGGAAVYQNCTFRGATDAGGELSLASVAVGDHLQVRRLVHTGPSNK
jgi:ABC-type sugar transport system substrate-binding protein